MSATPKQSDSEGRAVQRQIEHLLAGKDQGERAHLAGGLATHLASDDLAPTDKWAAEELARQLARDVIELVRQELSKAVRHCRFLPRDIAMRIAHDVDSVACPFLEVTEVFTEEEWQQLIITVSKGAHVAIARRACLSQELVASLAGIGDSCVAETLLANRKAPLVGANFSVLAERFQDTPWVLEAMVERHELPPEIVPRLIKQVSRAARAKLAETYRMEDWTDPVGVEAEINSLLRVIGNAPPGSLWEHAESLNKKGELRPLLLIRALRSGYLEFVEAALAVRARVPPDSVHMLIRQGGRAGMNRLCDRAGIPAYLQDDIRAGLQLARRSPVEGSELVEPIQQ